MTPTIDLLRSHRSIRHFTDEPITQAQRDAIIDSARGTSSSSFLQCSSIIRITDPAMREQLVTLTGGQKHVAQAAEFWVFCADFNRHLQICPEAELGLAEQLLLGVVDTALMAQNAFTAAESLGLGGVYIGGLRNNIESVTELLKLPKHVLPLFGLCLGWPADNPDLKPRIPAAMLVHENHYQPVARQQHPPRHLERPYSSHHHQGEPPVHSRLPAQTGLGNAVVHSSCSSCMIGRLLPCL